MTQRLRPFEAAPTDRPEPERAQNAEQFVAMMRQLRLWSGLSYRELEKRAQDSGLVLARATLAGALARQDLPREELLNAFVHACGLDDQACTPWLEVRRRLAVAAEPLPAATKPTEPDETPEAGPVESAVTAAADGESEAESDSAQSATASEEGAVAADANQGDEGSDDEGSDDTGQAVPQTDTEAIGTSSSNPPPAPTADQRTGQRRSFVTAFRGLKRREVAVVTAAVCVVIAVATLAFAPGRDAEEPSSPGAPSASTTPPGPSAHPSAPTTAGAGTGVSPPASSAAATAPVRVSASATPPPATKRTRTATSEPKPDVSLPSKPVPSYSPWWPSPSTSSAGPTQGIPDDPCGSEARDPCP